MSNEQVKEEAAEVMTAAIASRGSTVEFDLERPNLEVVKKTAQFLHVVPSYSAENPNRGAFVSLATQDFLQPLERGSRESSGKASAQSATSVNGDIPLQLSSRDREDPIGKESYSTRIQLPNLRMQYGYMEHPHAHVSKAGLEASQQPVMNRHWQQNPNPVSSGNKRPRSAQSEGDDTDVEERRKVHRDDASSRSIELKSSTSRSKHSATEQRRRSKINDRFQMLRELLPQGDQKRDKASFLLEVIEYIQVLQDKVKKFEALEKVRQQERLKQAAWDMHASTSLKESTVQETAKPQENRSVQVSNPASVQGVNQAAVQTAAQVRTRPLPEARAVENLTKEDTQKAVAVAPIDNNVAARQQSTPNPREPLKNGQEELPIKQGVISLSSAYSQGLLQALTNALQSSGLDLSKANISVQIELGKPSETTNKASQQ